MANVGYPTIRVEFYGMARLRAGRADCELAAGTLGQLLNRLAYQSPALAGEIIVDGRLSPHYRLSLNGERFLTDPSAKLENGDILLLISADAGG